MSCQWNYAIYEWKPPFQNEICSYTPLSFSQSLAFIENVGTYGAERMPSRTLPVWEQCLAQSACCQFAAHFCHSDPVPRHSPLRRKARPVSFTEQQCQQYLWGGKVLPNVTMPWLCHRASAELHCKTCNTFSNIHSTLHSIQERA